MGGLGQVECLISLTPECKLNITMDRWFTLIVPLKLLCHMVYRQGQYYITGQLIITVLSVPSQLRGHRGRDRMVSVVGF